MVKESPLRSEQSSSEYLPFGTGNQGVRSIHRAPFYRTVEVVTSLIGHEDAWQAELDEDLGGTTHLDQ